MQTIVRLWGGTETSLTHSDGPAIRAVPAEVHTLFSPTVHIASEAQIIDDPRKETTVTTTETRA